MASSGCDLQRLHGWFEAKCKDPGMRVITSKSEATVLGQKRVDCLLRVGSEFLPHVEEFMSLRVLFTSEGRLKQEIDRRISVMKRELNAKDGWNKNISQNMCLVLYC